MRVTRKEKARSAFLASSALLLLGSAAHADREFCWQTYQEIRKAVHYDYNSSWNNVSIPSSVQEIARAAGQVAFVERGLRDLSRQSGGPRVDLSGALSSSLISADSQAGSARAAVDRSVAELDKAFAIRVPPQTPVEEKLRVCEQYRHFMRESQSASGEAQRQIDEARRTIASLRAQVESLQGQLARGSDQGHALESLADRADDAIDQINGRIRELVGASDWRWGNRPASGSKIGRVADLLDDYDRSCREP